MEGDIERAIQFVKERIKKSNEKYTHHMEKEIGILFSIPELRKILRGLTANRMLWKLNQ